MKRNLGSWHLQLIPRLPKGLQSLYGMLQIRTFERSQLTGLP